MIKCFKIIHFWKLDFNGYLMVKFLSKKELATCADVIRIRLMFENLRLTFAKKRCEWECNKTIISENVCVFPFVKTSCYHLKVFVFKSNQIYVCRIKFTFVRRQLLKTLASILRQNEQHEQIEIMANHGSFCKRIKNNKESILKSIMWKRQRM